MRVCAVLALACAVGQMTAARQHAGALGAAGAESLLERARQAVGYQRTALHALLFRGTVTEGVNAVTGRPVSEAKSLEIRILLPDNYLRIDGAGSDNRVSGFRGAIPLGTTKGMHGGGPRGAGVQPSLIGYERNRLARLVLGVLAETASGIILRPQDVLRTADYQTVVLGTSGGPVWYLDLEKASHVPMQLRFADSVPMVTPLTGDELRAGVVRMPVPQQVEVTVTFGERRMIGRLLLPHLIVTRVRGVTFETMRYDTISLNSLRISDFEVDR